MPAEQDLS